MSLKITISGSVNEGKTTLARYLTGLLRENAFNVNNDDVDEIINHSSNDVQNERLKNLKEKFELITIDTKQSPRNSIDGEIVEL